MNPIEPLERRVLLDGDVTASFSGGDLTLRADDGDNHVQILQPSAGTIRVLGLDDTAVNGQEFVEFSGDLGDVRVRTRQGGEDTIEIQGPIRIGGDVNARLGEGEFAIEGTLGAVEVAGDVVTRLGSRSDVQFRNEVVVGGRAVGVGSAVAAAATPAVVPEFNAANFSEPLDIDNPYFPLVPGTLYTYEERSVDDETGETEVETVTIEVTNDTKTIQGVQTRVVRAKETLNGLLVEDTFDWHAQDDDGNVWYFGEDTTSFDYDDQGNLIDQSTAGSFQAGMDGARAGVVMLARPQVGDAYFQEVFVGEAIDVGEVLATDETLTTSVLGTSTNVLRTKDTTALEPDALEHKLYVPGFGLAREIKFDALTGEEDGEVRLVSATRDGQPVTQVVPPDAAQGENATGAQVGPMRFLGNVSFTSEEDAVANNVQFENNLFIASDNNVIVADSQLARGGALVSRGSIGLRGLTVAGQRTFVRAAEEVVVKDSTFEEPLFVRYSGGDSRLVVGDSTFGTLNADGGRGENVFEDLGGNEYENRILRRFEVEVPLAEAKLNIEHNATDLDTGFQGFIDAEGWQQLEMTPPGGDALLHFEALGTLSELGMTELFFETVEPENADVPIAEMLAKLPAGEYEIEGPLVEEDEQEATATGTALLTHDIPEGPELLAPAEDADVNEDEAVVFDWEPVNRTIDDKPVGIIAYQVIVEKVEDPHPNMIGKMGVSAYLPGNVTSFTLPPGFLEADAQYAWEVLAIEESGNQTLSSSGFVTGDVDEPEPTEPTDPPNLKEAKLIIEHNATDQDTGFQGFIDSEGWQRLDVTAPGGERVLTFEGQGELGDLGLTELFFETVEPEAGDVPLEEVLAALPAGEYTISGPSMQNGEAGGTTSGTATLTHTIPAGPRLLGPAEGATVSHEDLEVSWEPVTRTIDDKPVNIIAYQLIIEEDRPTHPHMIGELGLSMYVPATTTRVTLPAEVLKPGTAYSWEVLAIEESGNQTITESEFQTAASGAPASASTALDPSRLTARSSVFRDGPTIVFTSDVAADDPGDDDEDEEQNAAQVL